MNTAGGGPLRKFTTTAPPSRAKPDGTHPPICPNVPSRSTEVQGPRPARRGDYGSCDDHAPERRRRPAGRLRWQLGYRANGRRRAPRRIPLQETPAMIFVDTWAWVALADRTDQYHR